MKEREYHVRQDESFTNRAESEWDHSKKSRGLGDTVAKFTKITKIDTLVAKMSSELDTDCGCKKRQDVLNSVLPYKK